MERLIRNAWRAFWVGLGASAVLVGQALLPAQPPAAPDASVAPAAETSKLGPLARPLRTSDPAFTPAMSRVRTKSVKPGA
jgi:hypothetical protein